MIVDNGGAELQDRGPLRVASSSVRLCSAQNIGNSEDLVDNMNRPLFPKPIGKLHDGTEVVLLDIGDADEFFDGRRGRGYRGFDDDPPEPVGGEAGDAFL